MSRSELSPETRGKIMLAAVAFVGLLFLGGWWIDKFWAPDFQTAVDKCVFSQNGATISDGGEVLTIQQEGVSVDGLSRREVYCIFDEIGMPHTLKEAIAATTKADGTRHGSWGRLNIAWQYSPHEGMFANIYID